MFKHCYQHILIVQLFFSFAFSTCFAQHSCIDLFSIKKEASTATDPLDMLASLEKEIETISTDFYNQFSSDTKMGQSLTKINELFEEVFLILDTATEQSTFFSNKMEFLTQKINEFKEALEILKQRQANTDFKYVVDNPNILSESRLYELNGMDPMVRRVSFSKEVLEAVFWSDQPLMKRASELIIRGLFRGRQFATDKSGITPFETDKSVYKVKIVGNAVGALRVVGFFMGSDFHIVTWSNEAYHNSNTSLHLTEKVNRIRERFLKTGSY